MTAHYLVDMFGNPVTSSEIIDVREPSNGQSQVNGCFVVRVPDFAQVQDPADVGDLITKKYQGLLAFYAGLTHVDYDDLLDPIGVNTAAPGTKGFFGDRQTIALPPGGMMQSQVTALAAVPPVAVITWEVFDSVDSDPQLGRFERVYRERPSAPPYTLLRCEF